MKLDQHDIDRLVTNYREDYTPDVERGLIQLHARLTPVRQLSAPRKKRYPYLLGAAAAVLLIVAAVFLFSGDGRTYLSNDDAPIAMFLLPDGSQVSLQQGSRISYDPDRFNEQDRALNLEGQGYFEVTHDLARPFLVSNGSSVVRVTGTAFNVRADADLLEVEVSEGSVLVKTDQETLPVGAMEFATVATGQPMVHDRAPHLNHHAWRTGVLKFDHTPISEVLTYFTDNWGIVCDWEHGQACDYPVSGNFNSTDATAVLHDIAKLGGLTLRSIGDDAKHFQLSGRCKQ
ncbi:FecR family protein [Neolewinella xylanilytica]|uniref:FecR family protein n=1 Tax=Neolewinella xylanilytica TaxID=1514080 RepID=A0A2S6I5G7_9BACT|nr:FecR domain-containing protein [Neolewinella xylanilytica]PPK86392.1 FecR family protein [Neolewinella xylanilytica]